MKFFAKIKNLAATVAARVRGLFKKKAPKDTQGADGAGGVARKKTKGQYIGLYAAAALLAFLIAAVLAFVLGIFTLPEKKEKLKDITEILEEEGLLFSPEEDFDYIIIAGGGVQITKYTGKDSQIIIPETIKNRPVVEIGEGGWDYAEKCQFACSAATIIIPDGVRRINNFAFAHCTTLERIFLPATIQTIGARSFYHCAALVSVVIPETVTKIDFPESRERTGEFKEAFYGCKNLSEESRKQLRKLGYDGSFFSLPAQETRDFRYRLIFEGERAEIIRYIGKAASVTVPGTLNGKPVTDIQSGAFSERADITRITLPASIQIVGGDSFAGCAHLVDVIIPNSVRSIRVVPGPNGDVHPFYDLIRLSRESRTRIAALGLAVSNIFIDEVTVSTAVELVNAIRSNRVIRLSAGQYDFSPNNFVIENVKNLSLIGCAEGGTEFVNENTYSEILTFERSSDIHIENIRARHTLLDEYVCEGGVFRFQNSNNITVVNCYLDGCGSVGIFAWYVNNLNVRDTVITNCSLRAIDFHVANNVRFTNVRMIQNKAFANIAYIMSSSNIVFDRCEISGNPNVEWGLFELGGSAGGNVRIENSRINNNGGTGPMFIARDSASITIAKTSLANNSFAQASRGNVEIE